ncbi:Oidioi.mRNA.OKI2018_I69.chr2.g8261.t1.cds [Oikopleura dioica]|uniref:Oidioi.mRNA.OKI2018_I69.chr2.g8261.t1.cds n=1 Tax=Oikopleura dioica TaxID=34765 RepID=A0ABN7TBW5_OIKDI|nr:Oidioi.mRNA.OKI2018_I69.chr2.g8261.t1.cds [Oikopleura dioica]
MDDANIENLYKSSQTALILVDLQTFFYRDSKLVSSAFPDLGKNVMELLESARSKGQTIVHVRAVYNHQQSKWMRAFERINPDKADPEIQNDCTEEFAKELPGEIIIEKHTFNGFQDTGLEEKLNALGIKSVIVCGLVTGACVMSTANGAFQVGFNVGIVPECCGDRTREQHDRMIASYGNYIFDIISLSKFKNLK